MGEKLVVLKDLKLGYEGYFDAQALYRLIDSFTGSRNYDKNDVLHEVKLKEDGKYIDLDLRPTKSMSDHVAFIIRLKISIEKMTKEEIVIDGAKRQINKGKISITFYGTIVSDYEGSWEANPRLVFFRTIMDKFVYGNYTKDYKGMLKKDILLLKNEISSFLNLHKYTSTTQHH